MATKNTFNTNDSLEANSLINLDLSKLEKVCGDMETIDKALTDIKDDISSTRRSIDSVWDGDAAEAFVLQFSRLNDDLKDFEDGFKDVKTLLQDTSNAFRQTDQELYRGMDEAAKKAESAKAEDAEEIADKRPSVEAELEAEKEANLEGRRRQEGAELYSTMEAERPAVLEDYRRQPRPELPALQEAARDAIVESRLRNGKSELSSTVEDVYNARLEDSGRTGQGELSSAIDAEKIAELAEQLRAMMEGLLSVLPDERAAVLIQALRTMRAELWTILETAVQAVLDTYSHGAKGELSSEIPSPYNPMFEEVRRTLKAELYSTMEAEYVPVFEASRRSYRPMPWTVLFFATYVALQNTAKAEKSTAGETTEAAREAVLSSNPKTTMRQVVETVLQETVGGPYLRPAMRSRMADAVSVVIEEMPALLDTEARGTARAESVSQAVMEDYNAGSDQYRSVQRSILADKTAAVWIDGAMNNIPEGQLAQQLGQRVLKQIAPSSLDMSGEQQTQAAQAVGERMINYTWNTVSYDAFRTAGLSVQEVTAAVIDESAAGSLPTV
ncbi:MAG: WXG100 family type VII secretion target [Clostridia bacterium]|nr:WXG100 family type VII secretion target [Clostridia bacterium]